MVILAFLYTFHLKILVFSRLDFMSAKTNSEKPVSSGGMGYRQDYYAVPALFERMLLL